MRKLGYRIKILFSVYLVLAGFLVSDVSVMGEVMVTENPAGEAGTVFVAGNPELYPLEYYDKKDKCYKGVMPALLEEISRELKTDFVYVSAGTEDKRIRLAKNRQVEVISGCMLEEELSEHATAGAPLFPVTIDGEIYEVGFAYTELASEELKDKMEDYLSGKDSQELMNLLIAEAARGQRGSMGLGVKLALAFEALLFVGMAFVLIRHRKKQEEKTEMDRMLDSVTGVGNKSYFLHQFSSFISDSTRPLYYIMYMCFDMGRVDSYYGHGETENILRYAADILSSHVKDSDFFARVTDGGFAVAYQEVNKEKMEEWVNLVLQKVNEYSDRFGKGYRPEFCAGIYKLKGDDMSCETALYAAQQGYQEALRSRRLSIFTDDNILLAAREKQALCREIAQGIAGHQFHSYLQFMADTETGKIMGAEVLSRWQHPRKGLLMPGKYMEDMEEYEIVIELDFYMFEEACRLLQRLEGDDREHLILFCNFSGKTALLSDFADRLGKLAQKYCFDYHKLCLEITENSMVNNDKVFIKNIRKCKEAGFMIAIDDVGRRDFSFRNLTQYPIDLVKIDRELLLAASHEKGRLLLRGMNELFHSIHLRTLCVGIETQGQYDMIREMGVDYVQGFYIQRALPVKEAIRWLKEKEGGFI